MATKPELRRAVSNSKIKSSDWNFNFDSLNNYIENSIADNAITNYEADREFSKGQWVLAEVEGEKAIFESKYDGNKGNSLLDETYWDKVKLGGSSRNIGELVFSLLPQTDAGLHLPDGALINGNGAYADFVDHIAELYGDGTVNLSYFTDEETWQTSIVNYGVCGKFVYDSVANTVRLPKVTGPIEGTIDINALGELIEQFVRLPNITGDSMQGRVIGSSPYNYANGAIYKIKTINDLFDGGGMDSDVMGFDASRCSNVYSGNGKDTKIQQQAVKGFIYICIATSKKTDVEVNIDNVMTDVNGKADTDLTNLTNTGKIFASGLAMPSDSGKYIQLTVGSSGTQYTAPADGWIMCKGLTSGGNQDIWVDAGTNPIKHYTAGHSAASGNSLSCFFPITKGETFTVNYSCSTFYYIRFIYPKGSEGEV